MIFSAGGYDFNIWQGGFKNEVDCVYEEENLKIVKVNFKFEKPTAPSNLYIDFSVDSAGVASAWCPEHNCFKRLSMKQREGVNNSRTSFGAPVYALTAKDGINRMTVALSDAENAISIVPVIIEETAKFKIVIRLFTQLTSPINEYSVNIRIDTRKLPFYDTLGNVCDWWQEFYKKADVPEYSKTVLYSTWYNFHQNVTTKELLCEAKAAKEIGMENFILDDGWQTDDNNRGYAFCGDWKLATKKIPDMRKLSDEIHKIGLKFMIWYSIPFVGIHSKNFERFKGMYLNYDGKRDYYTLDPRFKEAREFLVNTYKTSVKEWNLDGLKLDFIDSFRLCEYSSDEYEKMDCISLEEGVNTLLKEIMTELKKINPDIMIEFRQWYFGPVMQSYGNMIRVEDCPASTYYNRVAGIDLRLISGKTPIHSDMIMWSKESSVEEAAEQFISILYLIPQISVKLNEISEEHKKMLAFYIDFWKTRKDILINGKLMPKDIESEYSSVVSEKEYENTGKKAVITLFADRFADISGYKQTDIVNGTGSTEIAVKTDWLRQATVYDCTGRVIKSFCLNIGVNLLEVPRSGIVTIG